MITPWFASGSARCWERYANLMVVGEAGSVAEAIEETGRAQPDVVLLDVRLGAESGFSACRTIRKLHRQIRVIILTSYSDENAIFDAMAAGADAYLLKEIGGDALVKAIEGVANGQSILDRPSPRY
jgi:two-component system response regulator DevR